MTLLSSSRLSSRDHTVVQTVLTFGQVSSSQLRRLSFAEPDSSEASRGVRARRTLARLYRWGEIGRIPRPFGGAGCGSGEYIYIPPLSRTRVQNPHTLHITELFVRLVEAHREKAIRLLYYRPEPMSFDRYGNTEVTADAKAKIETPTGTYTWYIEIDLSTEFGPQLSAKMRRYVSAWRQRSKDFFPYVVFVVPDKNRQRFVESIIRRQETPEMFQVVQFEEAVELLGR